MLIFTLQSLEPCWCILWYISAKNFLPERRGTFSYEAKVFLHRGLNSKSLNWAEALILDKTDSIIESFTKFIRGIHTQIENPPLQAKPLSHSVQRLTYLSFQRMREGFFNDLLRSFNFIKFSNLPWNCRNVYLICRASKSLLPLLFIKEEQTSAIALNFHWIFLTLRNTQGSLQKMTISIFLLEN